MESRGSWPCAKQHTTCTHPESHKLISLSYTVISVHLHIYTSSKWSFSFRFPCQNSACTYLLHHMWHIHHPISGLIITRVFSERLYKSWNHLLCNFPHPPVTSSLLATNVFPKPWLNTPNLSIKQNHYNTTWLKWCLLCKITHNLYMFQCFTWSSSGWKHFYQLMRCGYNVKIDGIL